VQAILKTINLANCILTNQLQCFIQKFS